METNLFADRADATTQLAKKIPPVHPNQTILLAIPRGGVPMAVQLSKILRIPMDLLLVRKLATPDNPEYAIGAVSLDRVWIEEPFHGRKEDLDRWVAAARRLLQERDRLYRQGKPLPDLRNKTVILVDDGIATGRTLLLSIQLVRAKNPKAIWVAVPVSSREAARRVESTVDQFICLHQPELFDGVGQFYASFESVTDEEVIRLMQPNAHTVETH